MRSPHWDHRTPTIVTLPRKALPVAIETAQELIDVIARVYRDRPDDYVVSVGHWVDEDVPDYRGGVVNII